MLGAVADFSSLVVAVLLGLLVGLQREHAASSLAGMRTFPLITVLGTVTAALAARRARVEQMTTDADGRTRFDNSAVEPLPFTFTDLVFDVVAARIDELDRAGQLTLDSLDLWELFCESPPPPDPVESEAKAEAERADKAKAREEAIAGEEQADRKAALEKRRALAKKKAEAKKPAPKPAPAPKPEPKKEAPKAEAKKPAEAKKAAEEQKAAEEKKAAKKAEQDQGSSARPRRRPRPSRRCRAPRDWRGHRSRARRPGSRVAGRHGAGPRRPAHMGGRHARPLRRRGAQPETDVPKGLWVRFAAGRFS